MGLTNREFGDKIGKTDSQISHWLAGNHSPQRRTIATIATITGTRIYKKNGEWALDINAHDDTMNVNEPANPYRYNQNHPVFSLIDKLPDIKTGSYSQADAVKLIEIAEALLRSAKEALKHSSDDS